MENKLLSRKTKVNVSLFAEGYSPSRSDDIPGLLATMRKKPPSKIDVFQTGKKEPLLHEAFNSLVNHEYTFLQQILQSKSRALDIINESFNHFESLQYGNLSEE